jgi:omega-6 fatty acid desaturase (delta-12 desaturase)
MGTGESNSPNSKEKKESSGHLWPEWYPELATFRHSDSRKAIWQLFNTLVPYCVLWVLMIRSIQLGSSYLVTLLLALLAAAFLVRLFILFHDCVHGSFFTRKGANTFFGYLLGLLVFTPFEDWRFSHLRHHVTYANLDARGFGDVWTMTLKEYQNSPKRIRLLYRLYRNPLVLFGLGAIFLFPLGNRLPTRKAKRKEHMSVVFTNLLLVVVIWVAAKVIGWKTYLLIQAPVLLFAGTAGIWLFYVQHQFEGGYWARKSVWLPLRAAMEGSSFYKLPAVFRWFSGNIGFHHVHHLSPRIPNYLLKNCYETIPELQARVPLTFVKSLSCAKLKLWDERRQEMMGFP